MGGWGWGSALRDYGARFGGVGSVGSWDRGIVGSVGVGRRRRPPPAARRPGGVSRWPQAEAASPRSQALERRAVDNFARLPVPRIAAKSLIPLLTYANLTDCVSHDGYYVK